MPFGGKSTVLRLFAGLTKGLIFDDELSCIGRIAMMAQQDLLMPWLSFLENVMLGARPKRAYIWSAPMAGFYAAVDKWLLSLCFGQ